MQKKGKKEKKKEKKIQKGEIGPKIGSKRGFFLKKLYFWKSLERGNVGGNFVRKGNFPHKNTKRGNSPAFGGMWQLCVCGEFTLGCENFLFPPMWVCFTGLIKRFSLPMTHNKVHINRITGLPPRLSNRIFNISAYGLDVENPIWGRETYNSILYELCESHWGVETFYSPQCEFTLGCENF